MAKFTGTGVIASTDYKEVKFVGKTKSGKPVTIELKDALNMGNIDWTFAEKDDLVAEIAMTATYSNTDSMPEDTKEPWAVAVDGETAKPSEAIVVGAGLFSIGDTPVALCRGGGKFVVEREFREINADGDRGPVKDRIVIDGSRATLTMNTLEIVNRLVDLYPAITSE